MSRKTRLLTIPGNHDITLDKDFYAEHGSCFHNQHPEDPEACFRMFEDSRVTYLNHESKTIRLDSKNGPKTIFKAFGSPYSPAKGLWAFGYRPEAAQALWDQVPLDADIIVTHTPPKTHCDATGTHAPAGCEILRQTLWRVRPRLAVCGHIHEGRAAERVIWDLPSSDLHHPEYMTRCWDDPAPDSKKHFLIDLTSGGPEPLRNKTVNDRDRVWQRHDYVKMSNEGSSLLWKEKHHRSPSDRPTSSASGIPNPCQLQSDADRDSVLSIHRRPENKETCIINAAIMASSWPYKGIGNRKYNKPIVVDIDLPNWENFT